MFENLKRDLIFLDIEATGLHVIRDRIVQLAMLKYIPGRDQPEVFNQLINPGLPISEEAIAVHGITPADVANKPTFPQIADRVFAFIGDGDLAGFNSNRFDIPMLMEEFARAGYALNMEGRKTIDVQRIFYKMEPRTLSAAYKFYCNRELKDSHDALADVEATVAVLQGQVEMYKDVDYHPPDEGIVEQPIQPDVDMLHRFTNDAKTLDATQRLKIGPNGEVVFNFGKYIGRPVGKTLFEDRQYYQWILNKEFSQQVKTLVRKILKEYADEVENQ